MEQFQISTGFAKLIQLSAGGHAGGLQQALIATGQFNQFADEDLQVRFLFRQVAAGVPPFGPRFFGQAGDVRLKILDGEMAVGQQIPVAGLNGLGFGLGQPVPFPVGMEQFAFGIHTASNWLPVQFSAVAAGIPRSAC